MYNFKERMKKGTISICFVVEALREARLRGADISSLLARANLSEDLLAIPMARVSPQQYAALWHLLSAELNDEFFGMDTHPMRPGSFSVLCHALLDCADLHRALERALLFFSLVLDDLSATLTVADGRATVTLHDRKTPGRAFAHGTLFVIIHGVACWLVGRRLSIVDASFCQKAPAHEAEYRLIFGNAVRFNATASTLVIDAAHMSLPVIRNVAAAEEFISQAPANFLVKYRNNKGSVAQLRAKLCRIKPTEWPDFDTLAIAMHTTPSTLRRRLEKEGSSYQCIKDDLRRDLAIDFLCNAAMNVTEIAYALGFSDHSAFHRAFKKWTGASPREYLIHAP